MNVSYASAFLVARLAALYSFRCVGPVALFNGVSSLSVDMLRGGGGGLLDSFSLVASLHGVYL